MDISYIPMARDFVYLVTARLLTWGLDPEVQFQLAVDAVGALVVPAVSPDIARVKETQAEAPGLLRPRQPDQRVGDLLVLIVQPAAHLRIHLLEPSVLPFQSLHLANHRGIHTAVFGSPLGKRTPCSYRVASTAPIPVHRLPPWRRMARFEVR